MNRVARAASRTATSLVVPVVAVLAYQRWAAGAQDLYFPPLPEIATAFRETWLGEGFRTDVLPSLRNLALGYAGGVLLGLGLGIALGLMPRLRRAAQPVVSFVLTLPPVALLPLFLLALGVGPTLQIGVIVFGVLFVVLVATADALRDADPLLGEVCAVYRIRGVRRIAQVLLPAGAPRILAAMRVSLSLAVLIMVVSELIGASRGIGAVTLLAQQSFMYAQMWAGMVLMAALGIVLNVAFTLAERPFLRRAGLLHGRPA